MAAITPPSKPGVPSSNLGGRTTFHSAFPSLQPNETGSSAQLNVGKVAVQVATVLLLLLASTVSAQERGLGRYKLPVSLLAGAGAVDISSTLVMAHYNAARDPNFMAENNPIVGWMEPRIGTPGMLTVGAALEVAAVVVACKLLCEKHPKLMRWGLLAGAGAHGLAAANNLRIHYGNSRR